MLGLLRCSLLFLAVALLAALLGFPDVAQRAASLSRVPFLLSLAVWTALFVLGRARTADLVPAEAPHGSSVRQLDPATARETARLGRRAA